MALCESFPPLQQQNDKIPGKKATFKGQFLLILVKNPDSYRTVLEGCPFLSFFFSSINMCTFSERKKKESQKEVLEQQHKSAIM